MADSEPIQVKLEYIATLKSSDSKLMEAAKNSGLIVPLMGILYLLFVGMSLISEKRNKMIDYLRTMGLLVEFGESGDI